MGNKTFKHQAIRAYKMNTSQSEISKTNSKQDSKDMHSIYQSGLARYFSEVKANAANYLQAVSDLQQEIINLENNNFDNILSLQKTVTEELGINNYATDKTIDLSKSYAENTSEIWKAHNKLILSSLDILAKNIEAFNKNSELFSEINKNLIDSCSSIIKQKKEQVL